MPILEDELEALKRALSLLQSQHISDIEQLGQRIDTLQQQIDQQRRRTSGLEQSMHQRFDTLEKALAQQFSTINQGFARMDQQFQQQTNELKDKFGTSDQFAGMTWGVVKEQQRDIREMKERFDSQDEKLNLILERLPKQ
ncbi:MAG TPA: hypothetical protein VHZ51_14280 [Ktedonobacteraceae bacterium]|jgi:capsule polysaccharide export protein KpsE/RkpR|nr:hypothetical protein [Ktedonobacteraceae bacterium]